MKKRKRLTEKEINRIKELREKGLKCVEIAKIFDVSPSIMTYHLNDSYKRRVKKKARDIVRNLTKKEMHKRNQKNYNPKYYKDKYHSDPQFRKIIIKSNKKYLRKKYKERKRKGLCYCGNKISKKETNKSGKKYATCKKCRKTKKLYIMRKKEKEKKRKNKI